MERVGSCSCGLMTCQWCYRHMPVSTVSGLGWFYHSTNVTTTRPDRRSGVILATRRRTGKPGTKRYV